MFLLNSFLVQAKHFQTQPNWPWYSIAHVREYTQHMFFGHRLPILIKRNSAIQIAATKSAVSTFSLRTKNERLLPGWLCFQNVCHNLIQNFLIYLSTGSNDDFRTKKKQQQCYNKKYKRNTFRIVYIHRIFTKFSFEWWFRHGWLKKKK